MDESEDYQSCGSDRGDCRPFVRLFRAISLLITLFCKHLYRLILGVDREIERGCFPLRAFIRALERFGILDFGRELLVERGHKLSLLDQVGARGFDFTDQLRDLTFSELKTHRSRIGLQVKSRLLLFSGRSRLVRLGRVRGDLRSCDRAERARQYCYRQDSYVRFHNQFLPFWLAAWHRQRRRECVRVRV